MCVVESELRLCHRITMMRPTVSSFLGSSAVEQLTVNQRVAGSNPVPGAKHPKHFSIHYTGTQG